MVLFLSLYTFESESAEWITAAVTLRKIKKSLFFTTFKNKNILFVITYK